MQSCHSLCKPKSLLKISMCPIKHALCLAFVYGWQRSFSNSSGTGNQEAQWEARSGAQVPQPHHARQPLGRFLIFHLLKISRESSSARRPRSLEVHYSPNRASAMRTYWYTWIPTRWSFQPFEKPVILPSGAWDTYCREKSVSLPKATCLMHSNSFLFTCRSLNALIKDAFNQTMKPQQRFFLNAFEQYALSQKRGSNTANIQIPETKAQ